MKWVLNKRNGKGNCPPYDGPCDWGKCSHNCRNYHKKLTNRVRRRWGKAIIKEERES